MTHQTILSFIQKDKQKIQKESEKEENLCCMGRQ